MKKLAQPMQQAITGSINKSAKIRRPRHNEIDWNTTIQKNLKHYQKEYRTVIPETRIGFGRKRSALKKILFYAWIKVDQWVNHLSIPGFLEQ